jgi:hypothetical protein
MESAKSSFGAGLLELQGVSLLITENIAMTVQLVNKGHNRIYYSEYSSKARQKPDGAFVQRHGCEFKSHS